MSKKWLLSIALLVALMLSCSDVTPEWQAVTAAKHYYDCLVAGNVQGFLDGKAGADSLPEAYRQQLLTAVGLYQSDIHRKHGGLREVHIADSHYRDNLEACRDTTLQLVYAFLLLDYADSTQEEITVPMVEADGKWLMR